LVDPFQAILSPGLHAVKAAAAHGNGVSALA
jgi:hypothetical protein